MINDLLQSMHIDKYTGRECVGTYVVREDLDEPSVKGNSVEVSIIHSYILFQTQFYIES